MELINIFRVREAENKETGEHVAIKIFDKEQLIKIKSLGHSIKKEISFEKSTLLI